MHVEAMCKSLDWHQAGGTKRELGASRRSWGHQEGAGAIKRGASRWSWGHWGGSIDTIASEVFQFCRAGLFCAVLVCVCCITVCLS